MLNKTKTYFFGKLKQIFNQILQALAQFFYFLEFFFSSALGVFDKVKEKHVT